MNREVHVRFWESAELRCSAPLTYLRAYATGSEARLGIGRWIAGYNTTRPHQALGYRTPDEVYQSPPVAGLAPTPIGVAA
jgi:putative transposase